MRAVGILGHQAAAVERRARAHAVGNRRACPEHQRPSHAIALGADLLFLIHLFLRVEKFDERDSVLFSGAVGAYRRRQRAELGAILCREIDLRSVVELVLCPTR